MAEAGATAKPVVPVLVIEPSRGWGTLPLRELWQHRELLWLLIVRNIKARYRQMALGSLWILVKPLLAMVVFSAVFGGLARLPSEDVPYTIFSLAGLLPWLYFFDATRLSAGSLVDQMSVISKVYFPRMVVPISAVISGLVDLAFSFLVLAGMMAWYGITPTWRLALLPVFALIAAMTALGVGLWLATLTVRFRDVRLAISYVLQAWMYATPVVYSAAIVRDRWPAMYEWVYRLNPMFWVVQGFRWCILGRGEALEWYAAAPMALLLLLVLSGAYVFRRTERTVVDLL